MSITRTHQVECECGAVIALHCADSLNAERHPQLRDAIVERRFHTYRCGACGAGLVVDKQVLYVDLERRQFYGLYPESERMSERACGEEVIAAWHTALGNDAPVSVAALFQTDRFQVRVCFGLEELREKLVAHEAGLSDLALEIYKSELCAGHPEWGQAGVRTLRLEHVEPDGRLAFYLEQATDPPRPLEAGILAARARYDELHATPWRELLDRHPWIASGPHVSLLRLLLPDVAEAAQTAPATMPVGAARAAPGMDSSGPGDS
jgi:hypothetical protein